MQDAQVQPSSSSHLRIALIHVVLVAAASWWPPFVHENSVGITDVVVLMVVTPIVVLVHGL